MRNFLICALQCMAVEWSEQAYWLMDTLSVLTFNKTGNVRITGARSCNSCCSGEIVIITYFERVCRLRYPACNSHAPNCPSVQYMFTLSNKRHDFRKRIERKKWNMCFDFLYTFFPETFSFWEELSEMWYTVFGGLHVKYPCFLSTINETSIFSADFWKILGYKILRKSVEWEPSCSMRADGQTDVTNLIVAAPKIVLLAFCVFVYFVLVSGQTGTLAQYNIK
jgi:hypothetical protein